jgi:response regulator RpfG family c-di-GMP phosphodiesterase
MASDGRQRVLCVDDEPNVLEGLSLHLRRRYAVSTATSGAAALDLLAREPDTGVVISDMRMPRMDGVALLSRARQVAPDAVRILLTGQADLMSAIGAINEGQLFRFLTKPCPPVALLAAVDAAAEQHRLVTAEKILLEQTLHGSIRMLTDLLSIVSPISFGRATRIRQHVTDVAVKLGLRDRWQVEVAAMLSQVGFVTLPPQTAEKVYYGESLSHGEQEAVSRLPAVAERLLGHIPRMEGVRAILAAWGKPQRPGGPPRDAGDELAATGAQLLRLAVDLDALEAAGHKTPQAVELLRARDGHYDPRLVEALAEVRGGDGPFEDVRELQLSAVQVGMVLAEDVKLPNGVLLLARGFEVTPGLVERVRNFTSVVTRPVRVVLRTAHQEGR